MNSWLVLESGAGAHTLNMALDEALLEAMPRLRRPVLRFYGWTEAAASFGYFQRYSEVEWLTPLRPLIRRPTAGGIVPHAADWTYALAFPVEADWYALSARESYRAVHVWIREAFGRLGIATELAPSARKAAAGQCFVGWEESDLLWRGQKIAGAAQRRTKDGLLIQGSVQPPLPDSELRRGDWEQAMREVAQTEQGVEWERFELDATLRERVLELESRKYIQDSYNRKR